VGVFFINQFDWRVVRGGSAQNAMVAPTRDAKILGIYNKKMNWKRSQKFFLVCLSFLLGIIIGEWFYGWAIASTIVLSIFVTIYKLRCPNAKLIPLKICLLVSLAVVVGVFWRNFAQPQFTEKEIHFYNGQNFEFTGIVSAEPDVRVDHQKLTISPNDYKGKVLVKALSFPEYDYGDELRIKCKLQTSEPIEDFRYDKYLARDGISSVCYNPQIKKIRSGQGNFFYAQILILKKSIEQEINKTIPEPQAALLSGILIGSRRGLPQELMNQFNRVGITHIIAISGYNITIIVALLMNVAKHLYINRKKVLWFIVPSLILFVVITGMSASVVRATIMGLLVVVAGQVGRRSYPKNILIAAAVVMALFNPLVILWDAGFQLSFLATCGLMFLSGRLKKYFKRVPEMLGFQENLVSTFSAIIMTLPLILFNFKRLSLVAPLANILVLPVVPLSMFLGFIQVVLSAIFLPLGRVCGWLTWVALSYILKITDYLDKIPWAAIEMGLNWQVLLLASSLLFIFMLRKKLLGKTQST